MLKLGSMLASERVHEMYECPDQLLCVLDIMGEKVYREGLPKKLNPEIPSTTVK